MSRATLSSRMTASATAAAGSSTNVVDAKVTSTTTVLVIDTLTSGCSLPSGRAPETGAVTAVNTSGAIADWR